MNTMQCPNRNHSQTNPPVGFCPSCGAGVNDKMAVEECTEQAHAGARMRRTRFCVDCGERPIDS